MGEHNHWIKYTNWETDARIPLIIHAPHKPHTWGTRQVAIVEHVDLYPSISELAGIPVTRAEEAIEGFSYAALFAEAGSAEALALVASGGWTKYAYTQYPRCNKGAMPINFLDDVRCANVHKQDFKYMGYSVRTPLWRYTEFAQVRTTPNTPLYCMCNSRELSTLSTDCMAYLKSLSPLSD